jgi:isopentenyl-diphosphate delta-isomerase
MPDIAQRKNQHLDIVLGRKAQFSLTTGFEHYRFVHNALPEIDLDGIDIRTTFLGHQLSAPILISSMTGGPKRGAAINRSIAVAAQRLGLAFGVGSQRIALEHQGAGGLTRELRALAPSVPILANLGAAQLRCADGLRAAEAAVDMLGADALIVHLNPLQEAVQQGGDRDWTSVLPAIARVVAAFDVPVIVKEVGFGISGDVAQRLRDVGVTIIDVAGAGGTSWAAVEAERATSERTRMVASAFRDWGLPTATALVETRRAAPGATLIASGGIVDGIDIAKAVRLGADLGGQAAGALPAALEGPDALTAHLAAIVDQIRIACFATGSCNLAELRKAPMIHIPTGKRIRAIAGRAHGSGS